MLAWIAVRLRFLVVPALIAAAVLAGLHIRAFETGGPVLELVPADAPALKAEADARRLFKVPAGSDVAVVQRDPNGLSEDAQRRIAERAKEVADNPGPALKLALPLLNMEGQVPGSRESGTTAVTFLMFGSDVVPTERERIAHSYLDGFNRPEDAAVGVTGATPARLEQGRLILDRLELLELLTLVGVALIVVVTLRSVGAAVVTLTAVAVTFPITIWALGAVADQLDVSLPQEMQPLVIALLLGVVTDYTVFFLSDLRDRLPGHSSSAACAHATAAEVIPIVFTGGLILAISLLALRASSLSFFRNLGPTLAITVLVAMAVSMVFVPALIGLFGRFAVWPAARSREAASPEETIQGGSGQGRRVAYLVAGRPVAAVITVLCVAGLLFAANGLRQIGLGVDLMSGLPSSSEVKKAASAAEGGFAPGVLAPTQVIVKSRSGDPLPPDGLVQLQRRLTERPGVAGALGPADPAAVGEASSFFVTNDGSAARYVLILRDDPLGANAIENFDRMRSDMPQAVADAGLGDATVEYGGQTALASSTVAAVRGDAFRVAGVVIAINLMLLIVFMRALPAPLVLLVANVLSVAAALGLTVLLFQDVLGNQHLTYYVPFASAVLLVALSSDYNVLVAGRIWHEAGRRRLREAIAEAAPRASRAIRAAGLALAVSFALVAIIPITPFRELAVAMVIGILLETYVVRPLLAPGLIALLGRLSGWPGRPGWAKGPPPAGEPPQSQARSEPM
jgi:putative drug exporter of the RND superfamily